MSSPTIYKGKCSHCGDEDVIVLELTDGEYDPTICKLCLLAYAEEIDKHVSEENKE